MKYSVILLIMPFCIALKETHATSFGYMGDGNIISIDDKPAICLPDDTTQTFPVGWISLSESYVRNPGSWGVSLKSGFKPLELKPGACVIFDAVPEGYELDAYKIRSSPLTLKVNHTYVFGLSNAYSPTDTYRAVFCISRSADGTGKFIQYIRMPNGSDFIPSCDGRRNGNAPQVYAP
ncbi:hypothetical protein ACLEJQ_05520 [Pseudomonas sp. SMV71]|uniref:hypothetical protein n=1 Tax=unclassified Pseudomonas TaxID=196821 RepID=UPI003F838938